jgi:hypothetical protein
MMAVGGARRAPQRAACRTIRPQGERRSVFDLRPTQGRTHRLALVSHGVMAQWKDGDADATAGRPFDQSDRAIHGCSPTGIWPIINTNHSSLHYYFERMPKTWNSSRKYRLPDALALLLLSILTTRVGVAADSERQLFIELNKLEPRDLSCLAYLVFRNETGLSFEKLQMELALFDTDGLILKRFSLDASPVIPGKTSVKLFEIAETQCSALGRILVNDVAVCQDADGSIDGCLDRLSLSSRLPVDLFK